MKSQLLIVIAGLSVWCPAAAVELDKPHLSGPSAAIKGSTETFFCKMPSNTNTSVLLKLYEERNPDAVISEHTVNFQEEASFPVVVSEKHDGRLVCEASGNNNTDIESTLSDGLEFTVMYPVEGVRIVSHPSSEDLWETQTLILQCNITKGTNVSYDWLKDGWPLHSGHHVSKLTLHSISVHDSGDYQCVASNRFDNMTGQNSSSDVISVQVKEFISKPGVTLEVRKTAAGDVQVLIRCWCRTGTPPNTFSLLNGTEVMATETTHTLQVLFNVSIQLDRDMGWVRCNASNQGNWMLSDTKSLSVESVGGAVTVTLLKHAARDFQVFGVVMSCKVERGTFPVYRWFLNGSRLEGSGGFYAVGGPHNSSLSLSVGRRSSGFYHCQASDAFDNTATVTSLKMLIDRDVLNRVSTSVLVVVFSCGLLLIISVTWCCVYGAVLRRRHSRRYLLERPGEVTSKQKDEEDLMLWSYKEDVVHAERTSDLHPEEDEMSVDESVLYGGAVSE